MGEQEQLAVRNADVVFQMNHGGEALMGELKALIGLNRLRFGVDETWRTDARGLPAGIALLFTQRVAENYCYIAEVDGAVARVYLTSYGTANVEAYGRDVGAAEAALEAAKGWLPKAEPDEEQVRVTFWTYGAHGPASIERPVDADTWENVMENYSASVRELLGRMMSSAFRPGNGGQLVLWSGPAGTGKTNALRALAQQWRDWCSIHYIVDPEHFFGTHADYLMEVLINGEGEKVDEDGTPRPEKWRLLVLEDSGELLSKDASERVGKALARLLNTVDGLIGQGLRVMVLVTTNEPVGELHEAISRKGRAAMQIDFTKLNVAEARRWRDAHDLEDTSQMPATLADLYAELNGFDDSQLSQNGHRSVGFATTP
jgi:hypothetical protein